MGFRQDLRAAGTSLLEGYKAANTDALKQIYPARPVSIFPPCAFIDSINEPDISYTGLGSGMMQRTPRVAIRLVRGTFDTEDVANAQDALVDGFIEYVLANRHAAGPSTLVTVDAVEDDPTWFAEWLPTDRQGPYYSTLVILGAEGGFGGLA